MYISRFSGLLWNVVTRLSQPRTSRGGVLRSERHWARLKRGHLNLLVVRPRVNSTGGGMWVHTRALRAITAGTSPKPPDLGLGLRDRVHTKALRAITTGTSFLTQGLGRQKTRLRTKQNRTHLSLVASQRTRQTRREHARERNAV